MSIIPTNFAVCKKIGSVLVGKKDWFLWQVFGTFQETIEAYFRGSRPILKAQVTGNFFKIFGGHKSFLWGH